MNLLPLFTCQGAIDDLLKSGDVTDVLQQCMANGNRLAEIATAGGWSPIRLPESLQSGASLLQARKKPYRQMSPERLRQHFHDQVLAVTTYAHGLVRMSMPATPWSNAQISHLSTALEACCAKVSRSVERHRERRHVPAWKDCDLGRFIAFPSVWSRTARSLAS